MWDSAFLVSTQRVTDALLRKPVLPSGGKAFEKVSAAIAVRTALRARTAEQTLAFLVPEVTASTARQVTAALLVGNHAHANGERHLPPEEARPLLKGDVLLVTTAVSESKGDLDELPIGSYHRLKDLWDVIPLSKYTKPKADKPRLFLANPGWMLTDIANRQFGGIVIDASHPRTYATLPDLLRASAGCSSFRLIVAPPMSDATLRACGYPERTSIWVWDPRAMTDAQAIVGRKDDEPHELGERFVWICDSDVEAAEALAQLHRRLVAAAKAAAGKPYPGLQLCWSIYDRLRQLTVPLAQLEQAASDTWAGSLRERMEALDHIQGHGDVAWETTWPGLVDAVKAAYQTLLKREETAKFWAVASRVETFISSNNNRLRIVVLSKKEGELLLELLSQVVDGLGQAMAGGRLEIVTSAAEARLVAEGQLSPTILLGPRTNRHRYLDVFASKRVDEFVYPHEVDVECAAQARLYGRWMQAVTDEDRVQFLAPLGFDPPLSASARPAYARPRINAGTTEGHAIKLAREAEISSSLDIDSLADGLDYGSIDEESSTLRYFGTPVGASDIVEVTFSQDDIEQYYASQNIDVFFSESGIMQRHPAAALQRGWQIISFVDGRYDGLFKRLTEVVSSRLPPRERIALDLWQTAKDDLFARYYNKTTLYEKLRMQGLKSSYEAFMNWFNGAEGNLAPQQFDEFEILAKECATYKLPALITATFEAVQHARGRNRACGRQLKKFLRAVVSGDGYNEALESARKLDTALGDVLAAVEVLEVQAVRVIQRGGDGKREGTLHT